MNISLRKVSGLILGIAWEKYYGRKEILFVFPFFAIVIGLKNSKK